MTRQDRSGTNSTLSILAVLIILGALVASLGGLLLDDPIEDHPQSSISVHGEQVPLYARGLYANDSVSCAVQARGQDIVTLLLGIPLLAIGTFMRNAGRLRGKMLQGGAFGYMLYTYASYSFLSFYNGFFLLYVALFGLSLFSFIISMQDFGATEVADALKSRFPRRFLGSYLIAMGSLLALMWIGRIVPALLAGTPPVGIEHYATLVIQALDLGVVVPASIITGVLLVRKHPSGATFAAVLFIKLMTMAFALFAMMILMHRAGVELSLVEVLIFSILLGVGIVSSLVMFRSVSRDR
jgi:hypothetical protein